MSGNLSNLQWRARRRFWNAIATLKFHGEVPTVIGKPTSSERPVGLVPFTSKYPTIRIAGIEVADEIPADELDKKKQIFTRVQHALVRWVSPMQQGLPSIAADAQHALDDAYPPAFRRCFPTPARPAEHGLGALAVASPYASYLQATGPGTFRWDLGVLADFECHPGLVQLGAVVDFDLDAETGSLDPTRIETALGVAEPGSAGWHDAERLAMCSITSHASMVRHFNWLHLTAGQPLEAVTRNRLPATHPIRRLLWAHVYGTHAGNGLVTAILLSKGGDFDSIFSLTHRGMCDLFEATTGDFDLAFDQSVARRGPPRCGRERARDSGARPLECALRDRSRPREPLPRAVLRCPTMPSSTTRRSARGSTTSSSCCPTACAACWGRRSRCPGSRRCWQP